MLGGCSLVNLTLFEGLHTKLQFPSVMVEPKGTRRWPSHFYEIRYLYWLDQLNLPLEEFKEEFILFAKYANEKEKLEWLKEWEEDARREGLYTIQP